MNKNRHSNISYGLNNLTSPYSSSNTSSQNRPFVSSYLDSNAR